MGNLYDSATPANVQDVLTTTANYISPGIADNVFNKHVTNKWFRDNAEEIDGGRYIVEHIEYDSNPTTSFINANDTVSTSNTPILTDAHYKSVILSGSATISDSDLAENNGKNALEDLVKTREKSLLKAASLTMNKAYFSTSPGALAPNSLHEIIDSSDPSRGDLGGIDRSTYSAWQSNEVAMGSFSLGGLDSISNMIKLIAPAAGMDEPTIAITTSTIFGYFENAMQNRVQIQDKDTAKAGFRSLSYLNTEFTYDENCTSGYIFYLNPEFIKMRVYSKMNMQLGPYVRPRNQLNMTRLLGHKYQITTNNPRKLGKHSGVTA